MIRRLLNWASALSFLIACAMVVLWTTTIHCSIGMRANWTVIKECQWGDLPLLCTVDLSGGAGIATFRSWRRVGINFIDPGTHRLTKVRPTGRHFRRSLRSNKPGLYQRVDRRPVVLHELRRADGRGTRARHPARGSHLGHCRRTLRAAHDAARMVLEAISPKSRGPLCKLRL